MMKLNRPRPRKRRVLAALALAAACGFALPPCARAAPAFWDGGGANNNWSTTANWVTNMFFGPPANDGTDDIIMQGTQRPMPNVDVNFDILSLQFSGGGGAGPFTIFNSGGAGMSIRGGAIVNSDIGLQAISRVRLGARHACSAPAGPIQVNVVQPRDRMAVAREMLAGEAGTSIQGTISGSGT
jgi:hypothetical protein